MHAFASMPPHRIHTSHVSGPDHAREPESTKPQVTFTHHPQSVHAKMLWHNDHTRTFLEGRALCNTIDCLKHC
eukprot:5728673-Amphidinium_carterae.1